MTTRKEKVTKEAQDLGIQVYKSWTIAEIEAEIAKKNDERVAKQREADREREARPNAITTSGMGIDPNLKDGDEDEHEVEEQVYVAPRTDDGPTNDEVSEPAPTEDADEDRNAVKNLPEATHDEQVEEGKVVVRYKRDVGSYTIGRLKFTPQAPFKVVSKEFAEKHFHDGHPDIRRATAEEVKEYYS